MLRVNQEEWKIFLLDTNFVTRMIADPNSTAGSVLRMVDRRTVFGISAFTLIEVRDRPTAYSQLLDWFTWAPIVIMKSTHQLLEEEIAAYPDPSKIDPVMVAPFAVRPEPGQTKREAMEFLFHHPQIKASMDDLAENRQEIVDSLLSLVPNYPPNGDSYDKEQIRFFAEAVCFQQIAFQHKHWLKKRGGAKFQLDVDAFPSIKAAAFSTFFRFYPDGDRRPRRSDAFDIATSTGLPYVEFAALENNQADIVRNRIPRVDNFLDDLVVYTFADLERQSGGPETPLNKRLAPTRPAAAPEKPGAAGSGLSRFAWLRRLLNW